MELIDTLRKTVEQFALAKLGKAAKQSRRFEGQIQPQEFLSIIVALPVDNSTWTALQDSLTGAVIFMLDGDLLDGGQAIG